MTLQPCGSDRLQLRKPGELILISPYDKGWLPRRPKTRTTAEFPGTAVQSGSDHYEVVEIDRNNSGRVRYVLEPWKEQNVIRVVEHYDEAHESERQRNHQQKLQNSKKAKIITLLGFIYGHLPAAAQNEIESEYGVPALRLTIFSTIPAFLFGAFCASRLPIPGLPHSHSLLPVSLIFLGLFLFGESIVRLRAAMAGGPIGSLFGTAAYWIFQAARSIPGRTTADTQAPRNPIDPALAADVEILKARDRSYKLRLGQPLRSTSPLPIPLSQQRRELFHAREPFLALLPPQDQRLLQDSFQFDFITWGRTTVYWILAFSLAGVSASFLSLVFGKFTVSRALSGLLAAALLLEQRKRRRIIDAGLPAGSVLGVAIRPFARELLIPLDPADLEEPPDYDQVDGEIENASDGESRSEI